jgi:hypothetical protein
MEKTTRKVVKRSPARTVYLLNFSGLLDAPVEAESSLERDFVNKAVLFPGLTALKHQPFKLSLNEGRHYTPDFLVGIGASQCVVEVKPKSKIAKYHAVFDEACDKLRARGLGFYVVHERALRDGRVHLRAMQTLRYRKGRFPQSECQRVLDLVASKPMGVPIGTLTQREGIRTEVILHLLAQRQLSTGPKLHLDSASVVMPVNHSEVSNEDQFARWIGVAPWGQNA